MFIIKCRNRKCDRYWKIKQKPEVKEMRKKVEDGDYEDEEEQKK